MKLYVKNGYVFAEAETMEDVAALSKLVDKKKDSAERKPVTRRRVSSSRRKWTFEDDKELVDLYTSGKKVRLIAKEIGRTTGATDNRITTLRERGVYLSRRNSPKGSLTKLVAQTEPVSV